MTKFLFTVISTMLLSATTCLGQKGATNSIANDIEKYNLSDTLLRDWNKDKNACLSLRCNYMNTISENKALIGIPKKTFIKLFGRPNDIEDNTCYIYNLCSYCDIKNKIKKGSDQAWMAFYFEDGKLSKVVMQIQ